MLLDTIAQFSQPEPKNQAQKLSEIAIDPSNHYQYANYGGVNSYQSQNSPYIGNQYDPSSAYNGMNYYQNQPQFLKRPQNFPGQYYLEKRDSISYPKTPIASGFRNQYLRKPHQRNLFKMHHRRGPRKNPSKRSRIYSPFSTLAYNY